MLTLNDPLEKDVLKVVFNASEMRLQRCKIRDQLRSKYENNYAEGSFNVVLQRRLNRLCVCGLLQKEYVELEAFYFIPNEARSKAQRVLMRDDIYDLTDCFDIKWLQMLRNLLVALRKEGVDPYVYFQSYCLGFVGGIPRTFHKSKEDMQAFIDWENALETRAQKEGITKEEYWRKMLKKAAPMPKGAQRILTSLGFTEEEIEELRKAQGGTFKVTLRRRKRE